MSGSLLPRCAGFGLLLSLPFFLGCGGKVAIPVTGKVLLGGQPLQVKAPETATVNFHPDAGKGNTAKALGVGEVNEQGTYTLTGGGLAPGWYKVTVTYGKPANPKNPYSVPVPLLAAAYGSPTKTPLAVEVKDGNPAEAYDLPVSK